MQTPPSEGNLVPLNEMELGELNRNQNVAVAAGMHRLFNQANRVTLRAQHNDLSWRSFISFVTGSVINLSPKLYGSVLMFFGGILSYLTITCATRFGSFKVEKTTNNPEEAFYAFFPEVVHITGYIISWIITFSLILPLLLVLQIIFGLLWLCSTIIYVVELVQKTSASGVHVASGEGETFKLPVLWFVVIQAVGFSLMIGLLLFIIVYLSWRYIHKGEPRNAEVNLPRLASGI